MQQIWARVFLITALAVLCAWDLPVLAAEGDAATASKSDKADLGGKDQAKDGTKEESPEDTSKKKGKEDISGGRFAGDPVYVHISPMVLPVISDQGVEQLVTVIIDVEVKDFDVADNMHTTMPRVKDALMRALYGGLGQGSLRNGKLVDVTRIKAKATTALTDILGDGIREVLIQGIAQRML